MVSQKDIRRNLEERIRLRKPMNWDLEVKKQREYRDYLERLPKGNSIDGEEIEKVEGIIYKLNTGELIENMEKRIKIKRYKEVTGRIFLENSHTFECGWPLPNEAISIIELRDRVEVLRFNLEDRPSPYLDKPNLPNSEIHKNTIVYGGIMPKKEYSDLFNYLERKNVWEIFSYPVGYLGCGKNNLFISKNQKKHAFKMYGFYNLPNLDKGEINIGSLSLLGEMPQEWKYAALKFLKISKEICDVSKKYAKTQIHNNQNLYKHQ